MIINYILIIISGPTFSCVIGKQFSDLKFGDRFYFEHMGESGSFTPAQLNSIRQTSLSKVICDNGDNFQKVSLKSMELISNK
jgi:peroxidase